MTRALLVLLLAGCATTAVDAPGWKAGTARIKITPPHPLWMSGYGSRTHPAEGTLQDLWVKALALEDPSGRRALILTADLVGIDAELAARVRARIPLPAESVMIACSHTHTGPMTSTNLECMFDLEEPERQKIAYYAIFLESALVGAAIEAMEALAAATLSWGNGACDVAVNRRNNPEKEVPDLRAAGALKGPVDHDVPVLQVKGAGGSAILFGYACHNTVLDTYKWSGDYAGYAQAALEKAHPGTTALFFMGCGGDQNPLPRRRVELAEEYGRKLAEAVDRAPLTPVRGGLSTRASTVNLPFAQVPDEAALRKSLQDKNVSQRERAKLLLRQMAQNGSIAAAYPYPVQVWALGDLTIAALGGEVVVDYSLRLKRELGPRTWVAAYCNDVMAYIPSERVLKEGGYEGGGAMVYYGLPSPWAPGLEDAIVKRVKELAK